MSQIAIIGVLGLMICCSSSSAAMLMMGGDDDTSSSTGPSSTGPAPPSGPPKGRYVKLEHTVAYDESAMRDDGITEGNVDDKNRIINLAELEVFDASGTNLAAGKTVTGSSEYSSTHGYINLTDGNKTNFAHTKGRTEEEIDYLQVDLGAEKEIKKLVITNRTSCCKNRAVGVKVVILADDGTTVVKETPAITNTADTYTLTFPGNMWS
ncbi:hypothetical protein OtV2_129 [Ostreococcus tauri virus 2]|jgi:hypothetical protein|uniref:hypothetical protein n=2 Tax=unclassified Prasinovirus TaxID=880158 RepID=UPI0001EF465A|nr:hypothetical protein OtV2_129 [Ostreococcus tauri virus 2]CBI70128.1 hypothetical protein OtV2_129 [Ostreococcus tauri virus 2]|tara:strand:+ start:146 stop:772 length:627 start_codon:yes stop_codon:yes gene_type:complete